MFFQNFHVLIAAAGEIQDDNFFPHHFRRASDEFRQGVRRFEGGDDAFGAGERARGVNCGFV